MEKIKVKKIQRTQIGRPKTVKISLINNKGRDVGFVEIYPKIERMPLQGESTFVVIIHKSGNINPMQDTRVEIT